MEMTHTAREFRRIMLALKSSLGVSPTTQRRTRPIQVASVSDVGHNSQVPRHALGAPIWTGGRCLVYKLNP